MALNTLRWTRMPQSMVEGFAALGAPSSEVDDATKEFVAQVFGDNLDLMFRIQQTNGILLPYEGESHECIPTPPTP